MKSDAMLHSLCALGGALLVAVFLFTSVAAVSIPVTSPNDGIGVNGDCTLREAIEAANSDSVLDACPAGSGADVILIPEGTITLSIVPQPLSPNSASNNSSGDLNLLTEMTLQGGGGRATVIDGGGIDRILNIAATANVTVTDLTLTNGRALDGVLANDEHPPGDGGHGGAVLNEGVLYLRRVTIKESHAGDGGRVGMPFPPWSPAHAGNGGGIFNSGVLTIVQSSVVSNSAGYSSDVSAWMFLQTGSGGDGGGIYNIGTVAIHNSTVADNRAPDGKSASYLPGRTAVPGDGGSGGGIASGAGTPSIVILDNVTVIANTAGRGGIITTGSSTNTGIGGDGGGLQSSVSAEVWAHNSILADNMVAFTANDCAGGIGSLGFNFIQTTDGCNIFGKVASNVYGVRPRLGPLGLYKGSTPVYYAPYTGPAVDRGSCLDINGGIVAVDQEATSRPQLRDCDIGASEAYLPDHLSLMPVIAR